MNNISLFEAARLLLTHDRFVILIHERPDGDAVGSGEALRILLESLGKKARVCCPDKLPAYLSAIVFSRIEDELPDESEKPVFVSVDIADSSLFGRFQSRLAGRILLKLDHHRTGEDFARFNYTDSGAAAAGELIFDLAEMLEVKDVRMYEMLYASIASDTGCFRYSNTTAKTLKIASTLYAGGINAEKLNVLLFESKDPKTVRATALGVENARFLFGGRVALCCFTNEMRRQGGFEDEHLSELSSALREIAGVELTVVIKQQTDDPKKFRLSTRSKSFFDCAEFCALFSGGGHLRAAGGDLTADSPEEARKLVEDKINSLWKTED